MKTQKPQVNPANKYRQILLEAILFFTQKGKIKYPSKTMIYKLLAEVDFRHFQETGQKVTNLKYLAYPYGPVPAEFNNEITCDKEIIVPTDFGILCSHVVGDNRTSPGIFKWSRW